MTQSFGTPERMNEWKWIGVFLHCGQGQQVSAKLDTDAELIHFLCICRRVEQWALASCFTSQFLFLLTVFEGTDDGFEVLFTCLYYNQVDTFVFHLIFAVAVKSWSCYCILVHIMQVDTLTHCKWVTLIFVSTSFSLESSQFVTQNNENFLDWVSCP